MISPLTSAIIVAHIGGEPADIDKIAALGKKYGIPVIEDCAQAHGAKLNGQYLGTFADIAAFSTMFGKHHCTGGQGGVVFTKNEQLYWKVRQCADRGKPFGLPAGSTNCIASLNFNLTDIAASIGSVQLKKLTGIVERRRQVVAKLSERFTKETRSIIIPPQLDGAEASYWWWRLEVDVSKLDCDKMEFCKALSAEGIPLNPMYRAMPHTMDWYTRRNVFGTSGLPWSAPQYKGNPDREFPCPNTMAATEVQFNLTVYESWGDEEINDIIAAVKKVEAAYLK
jgi:dTDP-4-amino-4,6-dideoxygalactose transaminase